LNSKRRNLCVHLENFGRTGKMHPYSTDSGERDRVRWILLALSAGCAWLFYWAVLNWHIEIPWFIDTYSIVGFYGLLYTIFEHWLWNWHIFRQVGLIEVPNLNGHWTGTLASSYDDYVTQHPMTIELHPT